MSLVGCVQTTKQQLQKVLAERNALREENNDLRAKLGLERAQFESSGKELQRQTSLAQLVNLVPHALMRAVTFLLCEI